MMQQDAVIEIGLLTESDVRAAMTIKELAGWNQTEDDWRCLLQLEPFGCFGAFLKNELVGTTTTTTYGSHLAWIGMVLVDPASRRQGIATKLMHTALCYLESRVPSVKLDATAAGQKVYEQLGFRVESRIERWIKESVAPVQRVGPTASLSLEPQDRIDLLALDRMVFGADRSNLLRFLLENACISPTLARAKDGSMSGYALSRRGSNGYYIGPVVTSDRLQADELLDRQIERLLGQILIDVNTGFDSWSKVLLERGFKKQREFIRMRYGEPCLPTSPYVFAIAGPEVG